MFRYVYDFPVLYKLKSVLGRNLLKQLVTSVSVTTMEKAVRPEYDGTPGRSVIDKKGAFQRSQSAFRNWVTGRKMYMLNNIILKTNKPQSVKLIILIFFFCLWYVDRETYYWYLSTRAFKWLYNYPESL